jgi:hypothetical protein
MEREQKINLEGIKPRYPTLHKGLLLGELIEEETKIISA